MVTVFYDWSGGMESSAMLAIDRERIRETGAIVRWADTGKQFPEMAESKAQIEKILGLEIVTIHAKKSFDDELFVPGLKGGTLMLKRGVPECSIRMKRRPLMAYVKTFPKPWEINLGFNSAEHKRADEFTDRNEKPWCHWRFPLIEANISRERTVEICKEAGLTILVEMYRKMGRFDCFMCPNQQPRQALKVVEHYPELAAEWMAMEERKGHSFMPLPLRTLIEEKARQGVLDLQGSGCSCFGGTDSVFEEEVI